MKNESSMIRNLSDESLLRATKHLVSKERETLAEVLKHLAEIQRRKLFSPTYHSLFDYAVRELGYTEDEASRRISAMRLIMEIPEIETEVREGSLSLTTLSLARTHFRTLEQNAKTTSEPTPSAAAKLETLLALRGKTKREAIETLVEQSPAPYALQNFENVRPIGSGMFELRILAKNETVDKITRLKGLMAHRAPFMSLGEAFEASLDLALTKLLAAKMMKRSLEDHPAVAPLPFDRRAGRTLQRQVWERAQGRCEICNSNFQLEVDHKIPFAMGGTTTFENLRLLCRNCNQREAVKVFGIMHH